MDLDVLIDEWLALPDVAELLGIPFMQARQLVNDHKVVAVRRGDNNALYVPSLFFQDGVVVKHLTGTLNLLRDAGYSDEEAIRWLFTPDETLPGSPIQALVENRGTEVKRRAQALGF
ncbi:MAG: hypothetical protein QOF57_275 [Frankiaceae bacterium]|jgi:hypothetical protein|nr:hypothetical protein [Frankiaceae bacterium]